MIIKDRAIMYNATEAQELTNAIPNLNGVTTYLHTPLPITLSLLPVLEHETERGAHGQSMNSSNVWTRERAIEIQMMNLLVISGGLLSHELVVYIEY